MTNAHYSAHYLTRERWISYVYQTASIADISPNRVAEIGVGPGVVRNMLTATYPGCSYVTIDVDAKLRPDVCASVTELPFADGYFDAVFCCQVLEHLPYDRFIPSLRELRRIARRRVILSLPDVSPFFYLRFPGARKLVKPLWRGISIPNPFPARHNFANHGQHYWEIGARGYALKRILADVASAGLGVREQFRMTERNYWHFFVLECA